MHLMIHLVHLTLLVLMQMKILFCGMKYHNKELFSPQTCLAQTLRRIFASRRYNLRQNQLRGPFRIRPLPRRQRLTPRPHGALRLLQSVLQWSYEGTTPPLHQCLTDLLRPTNLLRWPQRLHCLPDLVRMVWMPQPNLLQLAMDLLLPRRLVMGLCTFCI